MDKPLWGLRVQKVHRVHKVQRVEVSASKLWKAPSYNKTLITALGALENRPTSLRSRKCIPPLVAGATTFPPRWEACHWILSRLRLSANPVPLPPGGKRVTGFSVAYGSLRIQFPCHRKQGHYKAPLCCELLMKGLLFRALLSTVHILHRMCKSGEVRRLACP